MNVIQNGEEQFEEEGGCSTESKRVTPLSKSRQIGCLAIICQVHPAEDEEKLDIDPMRTLQEQLDSFCLTCPENLNHQPRESIPFS
ncbi:MAG: hypothetical protein ABIQ64_01660 [Candidatus Saccharimonadales bacterium]